MGLLNKIKTAFTTIGPKSAERAVTESEFEKVIDDTWKEYAVKHSYFYDVNLGETQTWMEVVKLWPDHKKVDFILWLVPSVYESWNQKQDWFDYREKPAQHKAVKESYLKTLIRGRLPLEEQDIQLIFESFIRHRVGKSNLFQNW